MPIEKHYFWYRGKKPRPQVAPENSDPVNTDPVRKVIRWDMMKDGSRRGRENRIQRRTALRKNI